MKRTVLVYAIFDSDKMAARAIDELIERDFTCDHICALLREGREEPRVSELPVDVNSKVGPGVAVGTALGAVGGALVATGGGLLVAGPLLALVQGAVGGGAFGFLAGFVGGLGRIHVEIHKNHGDLPDEVLLVGVMTDDEQRVQVAERALLEAGGGETHVRRRSEAAEELERFDLKAGLEGPYGLG